ncbi:polysaccharide deacetylase family protein [Bacillus cytotoxicus]|uniref:Polysaccharide deacetylase family protein n=1 Tax=Bacillus cytotoxicus TaxID=580165 RepID=A0ACC6A2M1_9BACI|nr:polysaccharide deacetylase family protein [Bacillus cytotoxicus]
MKRKLLISTFLFLFIILYTCIYAYVTKEKDPPFTQVEKLSGKGCIVLNYHRIRPGNAIIKYLAKVSGNPELTTYSVFEDDFMKQITYLQKHQFQFITPKELSDYINQQKEMPSKCALITFDDIDQSVYRYAYPFLKKQQIPFTIFIITGEVGNPNFNGLTMVTWDQIFEMTRSNLVTVGTHTHQLHYIEKDENPPFLKNENLSKFITDSKRAKQVFYDHFGYEPKYFAYPYGFGTPQTDNVLLSEQYDLLFTLSSGIVNQHSAPFFIQRVLVDDFSWKVIQNWVQTTS